MLDDFSNSFYRKHCQKSVFIRVGRFQWYVCYESGVEGVRSLLIPKHLKETHERFLTNTFEEWCIE